MTKYQEPPYQISLDIPAQSSQQQAPQQDNSGRTASNTPSPQPKQREDEQAMGLEYDCLVVSVRTAPLHATQISLLEEWSGVQSNSETPVAQGIPQPLDVSGSAASIGMARSSPVKPLVFSPTDSLISEPYLFPVGTIISSPGGHFRYRVLGACCRLFDRDELPWPCCRIQWRSKEPSWRRVGKRFVPDLATKRCPSYMVEILDHEYSREPFVLTLYWLKFPPDVQDWWYTRYVPRSA